MAVVSTLSNFEFLRVATSIYSGLVVNVMLCDAGSSGYDASTPIVNWQSVEVSGTGYQRYQTVLSGGTMTTGQQVFTFNTIEAIFNSEINEYGYDSAVIYAEGSQYPLAIIQESEFQSIRLNENLIFQITLKISQAVKDITAPIPGTVIFSFNESLNSLPELDIPLIRDTAIDTTNSKFGIASAKFSDSFVEYNLQQSYGLSDFCVEAFIYLPSGSRSYDTIISFGGYWAIDIDYENMQYIVWPNSTPDCSTTTNTAIFDTWQHLAVYRVDGVIYLAVDGVVDPCTLDGSVNFNELQDNLRFIFGDSDGTGLLKFSGNIDEARITYGSSPYGGSNFTPPDTPFSS